MTDDVRLFRKTVRQFIEERFVPHQDRWREQQRPMLTVDRRGQGGILPHRRARGVRGWRRQFRP